MHALVPGDEVTVRGVRVRGVPAEHPLCRGPIGFFLDADGTTVYFSGDTRPVVPLVEELRRLRPRVALVQISCAVYLGTPDGLTEYAAADLVRAVSPGVAVPMHYEARRKTPADPASFRRRLEGSGVRVVVPDRGREVEL